MKAVDADKLSEKAIVVQNSIHPELGFFIIPIDVAKTLKIVDAVEVVRCKDCYWRIYDNSSQEYWCNNQTGLCSQCKDNDYCSYGKRKENT